jgi:hypothetical protein
MPPWMSATQQEEELEEVAAEAQVVAKVAVTREERVDKVARKEVDQRKRGEQRTCSALSRKLLATLCRTKFSKIMLNTLPSRNRLQPNWSSFASNSRKYKKTGKEQRKPTSAQWAAMLKNRTRLFNCKTLTLSSMSEINSQACVSQKKYHI